MHIGILSFRQLKKKFMWEEKRLQEEALKRGHEVSMLRSLRCMMEFDGDGGLGVRYGARKFPPVRVVIPRASALTNVPIKIAIVEHLQLMGIPVVNSFEAIMQAKSKLKTLQILSRYDMPVVKTAVLNNAQYLDVAVRFIGAFPMIMKTIYGSLGEGVVIVESKRSVKSTYGLLSESLDSMNAILLQEYIAESNGKDIRIFVVGEKVVASMERVAAEGEFRSNVGQGGTGRPYSPSPREIHLAIRASKALHLDIAGVDIIQTRHGPAVMEVNANPGFQELEEVSGVNVAEAIIKFVPKFVQEYVPRENF